MQQMAFQQQQIKSTVETVAVMKEGLKVMKKEMKPLRNIGAIEAMMDETADLMMDANEVWVYVYVCMYVMHANEMRVLLCGRGWVCVRDAAFGCRCKSAWAGVTTWATK